MEHSIDGKDTQDIGNSNLLWARGSGVVGGLGWEDDFLFTDMCPYVKMTHHLCMQLCSTIENEMSYKKKIKWWC